MTDSEFILEYAKHVPEEFPKQKERLFKIAEKLKLAELIESDAILRIVERNK